MAKDLTDAEFFDEIAPEEPGDKAPEAKGEDRKTAQADGEQPSEDRPRDDRGRFASSKQGDEPKDQEQEDDANADEGRRADHRVPLREHLEERERRQALERQNEQMLGQLQAMQMQMQAFQQQQFQAQQPQQVPDPIENPDGYRAAIQNQMRAEFQANMAESSMMRAHRQYGPEFSEAIAAARTALPQEAKYRLYFGGSPDPGEDLMNWYRREKALREVGTDIGGYHKKLLGDEKFVEAASAEDKFVENLLKNPKVQAKAIELARQSAGGNSERSNSVVNLPTLSRRAGARRDEASDNMDEGEYLLSLGRLDDRRRGA